MPLHTILLVAARTATDPHVLAALRARAAAVSIAVTLLVPAIPASRVDLGRGAARGEARRRMHRGGRPPPRERRPRDRHGWRLQPAGSDPRRDPPA